jgi:hypothetical protein
MQEHDRIISNRRAKQSRAIGHPQATGIQFKAIEHGMRDPKSSVLSRPASEERSTADRRSLGWFLLVAAVLLGTFCASAVNVWAADWSFTPSATLSEAYDSNFRFTNSPLPGTSKSDFITSFTPVVSITGETEQTKFTFNTVTPAQAYIRNPEYDIINTNTTAGLTETWSPRFSTTANLGLTHDQTIEEQLQASGIIAQRTEHYQYSAGLGCAYGLSENLNLVASGSYAKSIYPGGSLSDTDTYLGSITPTWAIGPRNNIGLSSSFSYADYSAGPSNGATTIKTLTEMLFFQRLFSETMSFKLGGGYYFSTLDFTTLQAELIPILPPLPIYRVSFVARPATGSDGGFVFSADLKKEWSERFTTTFSAGRQQYNDVNARSFDSTSISGTASYKWSELTTVNFTARYNLNNQLTQGSQEIDYYTINPSIERSLTENLVVRLAGSYEYEHENPGGIGSAQLDLHRYRTWVDLTYKWPRFFASH